MRRPRYSRFTNNLLLNNNIFTRNKFLSRYNGIRQDFSIASTRPVRFCPNCACGLPFQRDSSNSFEFPWLAALLNNNEYFCSATLINDRYVLTTAQCMIRMQNLLVLFLDMARSNQFLENGQTLTFVRRINKILIHRLFRIGGTYNNDIALLRLDAPIIFDVTLTPVCLPPDFRSFEDFNGLVTAWNNLNLSAGTSPLMQQTDVRIIPNYECRRTGYGQGITENMICTRSLDSEDGACQSDNGGPLQVTNGTFYILVDCGMVLQFFKIVGGIKTTVKDYPWMVALLNQNRFWCGASVISSNYLLTAAHCVHKIPTEHFKLLFLFEKEYGTTKFTAEIADIIMHPDYNHYTKSNDIALLLIPYKLNFNGILNAVCLPTIKDNYFNRIGIAVGWGATTQGGPPSNHLHEVRVPIWSNAECNKTLYNNMITDQMLCAGVSGGGKDACQGDSGGPLLVYNNNHFIIVGIISWGFGCAQPDLPGVYTRVTEFVDWIRLVIEDDYNY
ncbi:hypothetical protein FQR65_LT01025 [Abscondita terminalis]|nr:hypothetical protein FQR65_LT01025 [Abscondita terminalis]